jgi:hypothetical protein
MTNDVAGAGASASPGLLPFPVLLARALASIRADTSSAWDMARVDAGAVLLRAVYGNHQQFADLPRPVAFSVQNSNLIMICERGWTLRFSDHNAAHTVMDAAADNGPFMLYLSTTNAAANQSSGNYVAGGPDLAYLSNGAAAGMAIVMAPASAHA